MKSVNSFKILTQSSVEPFISMDYDLMQQIQHIVEIAPKEAQWFHLMEQIDSAEFRISEMFIPEQICSSVEVDTDSQMMVRFWNELKEKYGVVEASNKLTVMTVWCHSHHNMAPSPSAQDNTQFYQLVKQQKDAGTNKPVLMFIFNKRNEYYSRLWDPKTNLVYEGLDIVYTHYDMSWIDAEAKKKFKEPPIVPKSFLGTTPANTKATSYYWTNPLKDVPAYSYTGKANGNHLTASTSSKMAISDCFGVTYNEFNVITQPMADEFASYVSDELESQEKYILASLLRKDKNFYNKALEAKNKKIAPKPFKETIIKAITSNKMTIGLLECILTNVFEMYDQLLIEDKESFDVWTTDVIDMMEETLTEPKPQYTLFSK